MRYSSLIQTYLKIKSRQKAFICNHQGWRGDVQSPVAGRNHQQMAMGRVERADPGYDGQDTLATRISTSH